MHLLSNFNLFVVPTQCSSYSLLNDPWRLMNTTGATHCDSSLATGWYRLQQNGANALMPTSCPAINTCSTQAPMWYNGKKLARFNNIMQI